jgi:hypothetical protein
LVEFVRGARTLLRSFVLGSASFAANAIKLISRACGVEPFTRFLEAILEAEFKGNWRPSMELAGRAILRALAWMRLSLPISPLH